MFHRCQITTYIVRRLQILTLIYDTCKLLGSFAVSRYFSPSLGHIGRSPSIGQRRSESGIHGALSSNTSAPIGSSHVLRYKPTRQNGSARNTTRAMPSRPRSERHRSLNAQVSGPSKTTTKCYAMHRIQHPPSNVSSYCLPLRLLLASPEGPSSPLLFLLSLRSSGGPLFPSSPPLRPPLKSSPAPLPRLAASPPSSRGLRPPSPRSKS